MTTREPGDEQLEPEDEQLAKLLSELSVASSAEYPDWKDGSDLSRLHIEAFARSRSAPLAYRVRVLRPTTALSTLRDATTQIKDIAVELANRSPLVSRARAARLRKM